MSTIKVTHAESGLVKCEVARAARVSPHVVRVTLAGQDLERFRYPGFDQWFRLAIPVHGGDRFSNLPNRFGVGGLVRYMTMPRGTRPVIRNYTIRQYRADPAEIDVDFVVHGTPGAAAPWAASVTPGTPVALIDQGYGWNPASAPRHLIVADESGMPAALAVLRDMPRDAQGDAVIELFDERDRQDHEAPDGMNVRWAVRVHRAVPGASALPMVRDIAVTSDLAAFAVGESGLATGARRYLVNERGVPKERVTFCGYWRIGRAAPG
ncbi:siderophore-interacting protein [Rarobacter incanus]|uniref:NADPH-dependent ferric siderophore reductase n=1 Tax=Rarobacter incanus TaxID=153494 RepID=A0A542SM42_9MICO|nr:siderophore-interacting protein [Rarobacter incanus]TQK75691.1 NADPH-dependent ferric siderophore reductase [Rarobacter incanus]